MNGATNKSLTGIGMARIIRWQTSVPIFKNPVILRQLTIALGIPLGLVALIIGLSPGKGTDTLYALVLIVAWLVLAWLFIMAVYRGKYEAEFVLDSKGALCRTQAEQKKKNRVINTLNVILGLLTGKPAVAGVGLLAQSRQKVLIRWNRIRKIKYKPKSHTILLYGGWTEQIALFCTQDNYALVEKFVLQKIHRMDEVNRNLKKL